MEYTSRYDFALKELDLLGELEGYCSVFNNVDRQGDKILKGAFKDTLEETGGKFPLLMGHDTGRICGFATGAKEDAHGLKVRGQLAIDADDGRNCYAIARLAQQLGTPLKMSFGYQIRENGSHFEGNTRVLTAVNIWEASVVAIPANPRAQITSVKESLQDPRMLALLLMETAGFPLEDANYIANHGFDAYKARQATGGGFATVIEAARKLYKN